MSYRPRRSTYTHEQWLVQRERFQIDRETPAPVKDQEAATIKEPLRQLLKSLGLETDSLQHQLMERWNTIAGHPMCRHIRPGPLQNAQLTVYVSNSTMLTELSRFQGPALLKNIQQALGEGAVKKLRFQLDPDTRPGR